VTEFHDELVQLTVADGRERSALAPLEAHVATCAQCQADLPRALLAARRLADSASAPSAAMPEFARLELRLTDDVRLLYFAPQVASLFDLSLGDAKALLGKALDPTAWEEGPSPNVKVLPVQAGPGASDNITALVKVEPGQEFPHHEHLGPEHVLVLQGGYRCSTGEEKWRGEVQQMSSDRAHSFVALGNLACICAARNAFS